MSTPNQLAVFVKPWKSLTLKELGERMQQIGFAWIELPVRPGFACQPETIERDLPEAAKVLGDYGVGILNVTVDLPLTDERLYAACAAAGVNLNRAMFRRGDRNYWEAEDDAPPVGRGAASVRTLQGAPRRTEPRRRFRRRQRHDALPPARRLRRAICRRHLDAAHEALEGMEPEPCWTSWRICCTSST